MDDMKEPSKVGDIFFDKARRLLVERDPKAFMLFSHDMISEEPHDGIEMATWI
jgi:hypothetical protein